MQTRKIPKRMCIGCGEMKEKRELIRVVKNKDGEISLDLTGKKPGRGAYVCKSSECLKKAQKARRLQSAFSMMIEGEVYERLLSEVGEDNAKK